MERVAIAGVGLIGASFGLALRKAGFGGEIVGVSSEAALAAGLRCGAITKSATLEEAAQTAAIIRPAKAIRAQRLIALRHKWADLFGKELHIVS